MKTHFNYGPHGNACGRAIVAGTRTTTNVYAVTCGACIKTPRYQAFKKSADDAKFEKFMAQEPRQFMEPWHTEKKAMHCRECGNGTFRIGDRTCHGHYENYHCAECGHVESRLTETGMSF